MKKKTTFKRLLTLTLALVMLLALAAPAMASTTQTSGSTGPYEITINPSAYTSTPDDLKNNEDITDTDGTLANALTTRFWAYQIFTGTINPTKTGDSGNYESGYDPGTTTRPDGTIADPNANQLADVKWGASVEDYSGLLTALTTSSTKLSDLGVSADVIVAMANKNVYGTLLKSVKDILDSEEVGTGQTYEDKDAQAAAAKAAAQTLLDGNTLTLGAVFSATAGSYISSGADSAPAAEAVLQALNDLMTRTDGKAVNNSALAQAFADIVAEKNGENGAGSNDTYKYLKNSGGTAYGKPENNGDPGYLASANYKGAYAVSQWTEGSGSTKGYWTIGDNNQGTSVNENWLSGGYYLIRDEYQEGHTWGEDGPTNTDRANSEFIVSVLGNTTITAKAAAPSAEKEIINYGYSANSDGKIRDAKGNEIGDSAEIEDDTIWFRLIGTLPENYYTAYTHYIYKFHDTLDAGLTYTGDPDEGTIRVFITVTEVSTTEPSTTRYTVYEITVDTSDADTTNNCYVNANGQSLNIIFNDLKAIKGKIVLQTINGVANPDAVNNILVDVPVNSASEIYVDYTAKLNDKAITGKYGADLSAHGGPSKGDVGGNQNKVYVEYSNDPTWKPASNPETASSWFTAPTGYTTEDVVQVYTYGVEIYKIDGETGEPLAGAGFTLSKVEPGETLYAYYDSNEATAPAGWITESQLQDYLGDGEISTYTDGGQPLPSTGSTSNFPAAGKYLKSDEDSDTTSPVEPVTYYAQLTKVTTTYYQITKDAATAWVTLADLSGYEYNSSSVGDSITYVSGATLSKAGGIYDGYQFATLKNSTTIVTLDEYTLAGWNTSGTEITTPASGYMRIIGLDEGEYILSETTTPNGYDTMDDTTIKIEPTIDEDGVLTGLTATVSSGTTDGQLDATATADKDTGIIKLTMRNYSALWAPGTGGMGTTLFYILGGALIATAAAFLFLNKQKGKYAR